MKPYGIPLYEVFRSAQGNAIGLCERYDDLFLFARKGSLCSLKNRNGEYRSQIRKRVAKKAIRRIWKKKARQNNKYNLNKEIQDAELF